jgi:VWFA-related protein
MTLSPTRVALGGIWIAVLALAVVPYRPLGAVPGPGEQAPTFRSSVDLIAVDAQVVDSSGTPIPALAPADFEVSISGKRRRVVSADFIRSTDVDGTPFLPSEIRPAASNTPPGAAPAGPVRIYILAFDVGSMTVGDSRAVVRSALTFIDRLLPSDLVGMYAFPIGERVDPTTDHGTVRQKLGTVVGSRSNSQGFDSRFNLSPSEIVDINAESVRATPFAADGLGRGSALLQELMVFGDETDTIRNVQMRECGRTEVRCGDEIRGEALALATQLEAQASEGLNGIRRLIRVLWQYQARKTVVMFSSGMPSSDRPGGRPDLGRLPEVLGKDAAATNTTIYTLYVDSAQVRAMGAATGRAVGSPGTRSRDHALEARVLEEFSGASGGALIRVPTGSGERALDRVLRETSSHYLLGVEPAESDRDGTVRELRVKVRQNPGTVRSRMWVIVPKRER